MQAVAGKRVTVLGLGHFGGGVGVARWLVAQGATVRVCDRAPADTLKESVEALAGLPIEFRLGRDDIADVVDADLIVASPAIPPDNALIQAARSAAIAVTTEIRLFVERCRAQTVGVTGTKGKSTTTALLERMLRTKFTIWKGGNYGGSLLGELPNIRPDHIVLLELSSFMLEHLGHARWSPGVAVVTVVLEDHLDWHKSSAAYVDAKRNIVRFQPANALAILNADDPASRSFAAATAARVVNYSIDSSPAFPLLLPGEHNQLNAQAAWAAANELGVPRADAGHSIADFPGLPHRLERVHVAHGVAFYNDSIATIPQAAVVALNAFPPRTVIQIVGGFDKGLPNKAMIDALATRAKAVICIGQTGPALHAALLEHGGVPTFLCRDLSKAIAEAISLARHGDTVLLSPGYASYGEFTNFEHRGETFTRLVKKREDNRV